MEKDKLRAVLVMHARRYPAMKPQDVIKLCYQSEFGGGHLIRDIQSSLQFIAEEMASVESGYPAELLEEIGNGFARIHLGKAKAEGITAEQINEAFVRSSEQRKGTLDSFLTSCRMVLSMTEEHAFLFTAEEMSDYLAAYQKLGCPAVSHSEAYRSAYHPAYRIVDLDIWQRLQ